jgi:hypothetical protein
VTESHREPSGEQLRDSGRGASASRGPHAASEGVHADPVEGAATGGRALEVPASSRGRRSGTQVGVGLGREAGPPLSVRADHAKPPPPPPPPPDRGQVPESTGVAEPGAVPPCGEITTGCSGFASAVPARIAARSRCVIDAVVCRVVDLQVRRRARGEAEPAAVRPLVPKTDAVQTRLDGVPSRAGGGRDLLMCLSVVMDTYRRAAENSPLTPRKRAGTPISGDSREVYKDACVHRVSILGRSKFVRRRTHPLGGMRQRVRPRGAPFQPRPQSSDPISSVSDLWASSRRKTVRLVAETFVFTAPACTGPPTCW